MNWEGGVEFFVPVEVNSSESKLGELDRVGNELIVFVPHSMRKRLARCKPSPGGSLCELNGGSVDLRGFCGALY